MANEINLYEPRTLAEVVRTTPPVHTFFLDKYFTHIKTFPTKRVDLDIVKGDRRMAPFVHPLVGGKVMRNAGYATESYAPPLVNPLDVTTAEDALERLPGEDIYSGKTPEERAAQQLIEEYKKLNDAATRREEWMAVQAIMEGQIHVIGEGVNEVIEFGFTNKVKLDTAKQWGKSGATPLDNLGDWVDMVLVNGFANVDHAIMGKVALRKFLNDEGVQKLLDWTNPLAPETKPLIDDNKIALMPSNPDFMRAYARCSYIDDVTKRTVTAQTERLLRTYVKHGPDRKILELQTRPLTIPDKVDSWLVAEVC